MRARRLLGPLLLVVFFSSLCAPALSRAQGKQASGDPAKIADIRKLLTVTGSGKLGLQLMGQMVQTFKTTMPSIPDKFWTDFMKEVDTNDLINLLIPVYDKNLSHPDIKAIIQFYETPAGKKFIAVMPAITQESMAIGQQWGQELGRKVAQKLQAEQAQQNQQPGGAGKKK